MSLTYFFSFGVSKKAAISSKVSVAVFCKCAVYTHVSLYRSIPASTRPATSKVLPFCLGTLPPHVLLIHLLSSVIAIQSHRTSVCHGSSRRPPINNSLAASSPSVAKYSGEILADGSCFPTILTVLEDVGNLVIVAISSLYFFNIL